MNMYIAYFNMYCLLLGRRFKSGMIYKIHINEFVGDWPEWFKEIGIQTIK